MKNLLIVLMALGSLSAMADTDKASPPKHECHLKRVKVFGKRALQTGFGRTVSVEEGKQAGYSIEFAGYRTKSSVKMDKVLVNIWLDCREGKKCSYYTEMNILSTTYDGFKGFVTPGSLAGSVGPEGVFLPFADSKNGIVITCGN